VDELHRATFELAACASMSKMTSARTSAHGVVVAVVVNVDVTEVVAVVVVGDVVGVVVSHDLSISTNVLAMSGHTVPLFSTKSTKLAPRCKFERATSFSTSTFTSVPAPMAQRCTLS
jgi:hypothetical protein